MPTRRELPRDMEPDPDDGLSETGPEFIFIAHSDTRADNEYQALMECAPFEEPQVSRADRLELRDVICDALETLDAQQQWIFDGLFVRKLSLRQLGAEINVPKTTVATYRDRLLQHLTEKLVSDPKIAEYLEGKQR